MNFAKKILKAVAKIMLVLLCLILVIIVGLLFNNRISAISSAKLNTTEASLSADDVKRIEQVYSYLNKNGNSIFPGFNGKGIDLIIFNDSYEFLISNNKSENQWTYIDKNNELGAYIYRRVSQNPQAFTVNVNNRWVGSMSTMDTYNKSITKEVGYLFPPQLITIDSEHYKGIVIHEMVHALVAEKNEARLKELSSLHDVCSQYYSDIRFNNLLALEGKYLEQAINSSTKEEIITNAKAFLDTRQKRRVQCSMKTSEIKNEMDYEWLEGLARYAEYKASEASKSLVRKSLNKIEQKVKVLNDDRYYATGMAEAIILDKLKPEWKRDMYLDDFYLERELIKVLKQ